MYCNKCGTQIPDGALFCTHCGANLRPTGNAPATQAPPTSEAERAPISAAASAPATTTTVATSAADARQSPNKQKQGGA